MLRGQTGRNKTKLPCDRMLGVAPMSQCTLSIWLRTSGHILKKKKRISIFGIKVFVLNDIKKSFNFLIQTNMLFFMYTYAPIYLTRERSTVLSFLLFPLPTSFTPLTWLLFMQLPPLSSSYSAFLCKSCTFFHPSFYSLTEKHLFFYLTLEQYFLRLL